MSRSRDGMFAAMKTEKFLKVPILYWKWEITQLKNYHDNGDVMLQVYVW